MAWRLPNLVYVTQITCSFAIAVSTETGYVRLQNRASPGLSRFTYGSPSPDWTEGNNRGGPSLSRKLGMRWAGVKVLFVPQLVCCLSSPWLPAHIYPIPRAAPASPRLLCRDDGAVQRGAATETT